MKPLHNVTRDPESTAYLEGNMGRCFSYFPTKMPQNYPQLKTTYMLL